MKLITLAVVASVAFLVAGCVHAGKSPIPIGKQPVVTKY
jgi:hypothetical protein